MWTKNDLTIESDYGEKKKEIESLAKREKGQLDFSKKKKKKKHQKSNETCMNHTPLLLIFLHRCIYYVYLRLHVF